MNLHQLSKDEIIAALSGLDEKSNTWRAFTSLADWAVADETKTVCGPNMTDENRQYNSGRLSHAMDFRGTMDDMMAEAKKRR
jgi:hypothetical protein